MSRCKRGWPQVNLVHLKMVHNDAANGILKVNAELYVGIL